MGSEEKAAEPVHIVRRCRRERRPGRTCANAGGTGTPVPRERCCSGSSGGYSAAAVAAAAARRIGAGVEKEMKEERKK